jgi:hypothetical protein
MTAQELNKILTSSRKVTLIIENEWKLSMNKDSSLKDSILITNLNNCDKWERFENDKQAVKFFMSKIAYFKRRFKIIKMDREVTIETI